MTDMVVEIMVEVINVLAIATKEVKCGRLSESMSLFYLPYFDTHLFFRTVAEEVDGKLRHRR
jgi:hypothetical protein